MTDAHRTKDREVKATADYRFSCVVCGEKPTVTLKDKDGREHRMKLCGVCCFGEAACVDPKEWVTA